MNLQTLKDLILRATGMLGFVSKTIKPGLYVFNYHRIGNSHETEFDPNVFSCNEEQFSKQIDVIKSRFRIINTKQLFDIIERGLKPTEPLAMITFDDGYRDNYEKAYPILRAAKVSAIFFLPTSYIGSKEVAWWDEVAWLVKNSTKDMLKLAGWDEAVQIDRQNISATVRRVLFNIKKNSSIPLVEQLTQIREECGGGMPGLEDATALFMTWDNVKEIHEGGMEIGSHAHSHEILSHLNVVQQRFELENSKSILEKYIKSPVEVLAYPVGGKNSYTADTCRIAKECGFKAAFTFINGFNRTISDAPYELARISVHQNSNYYALKYITN